MLLHKLNVISEKHLVVEDQEKLSKVTCTILNFIIGTKDYIMRNILQVKAAYEMVKKLEPLMVVLPSVVERLLALKQLHEDGNCLVNNMMLKFLFLLSKNLHFIFPFKF